MKVCASACECVLGMAGIASYQESTTIFYFKTFNKTTLSIPVLRITLSRILLSNITICILSIST